jgi:hypothetical protein
MTVKTCNLPGRWISILSTLLLLPGGEIVARKLAVELHITQAELAAATSLNRDAGSKQSRGFSRKTQSRLRDTLEIINRVSTWASGTGRAFEWFRSQPLPSFSDKTAEDLVK